MDKRQIEIINVYDFVNIISVPDEIIEEIEDELNIFALENDINIIRCEYSYYMDWKGFFYNEWQKIIDLGNSLINKKLKNKEESLSMLLRVI